LPDQTTACFADLLDEKLQGLIDLGYEVRRIFAVVADIEQIFVARGDSAIMLDCDPKQDRAWYGRFELTPALEADRTMLMYCQGEACWISDLDTLPTNSPAAVDDKGGALAQAA
jgi:hypothetical protein